MRKYFINVVAILSMVVFLMGCDSKKEAETSVDNETSTAAETNVDNNAEENSSSEESASTDKSFVDNVAGTDDETVRKVEEAFTSVYDEMCQTGLTNDGDIIITLNSDNIVVDITPGNDNNDLTLYWIESEGIYTLAIDYDCWYIADTGATVNGIDRADYNVKLTKVLLGLISADEETIFSAIESTLYSAYSLSDTEWTQVGDCDMMYGDDAAYNAYTYKIKVK